MQWIHDIAAACEYAMATGLVHGPLSVDDLFVGDDGQVTIADFGVKYYLECFLQKVSAQLSDIRVLADLGLIQRQLLQPLSKDIDGLEEEILAGIANEQLQKVTARLLPEKENSYRSITELLSDIEILLTAEPVETRPMVQHKNLETLDDTGIYLHERDLVLPQLRDLIAEKNRYKALLDETLIDHNKLESNFRKTRLELEHLTTLQLEAPKQKSNRSRKQIVACSVVGFLLGAILSAAYGYTLLRKVPPQPLPLVEIVDITNGDVVATVKVETEELSPNVVLNEAVTSETLIEAAPVVAKGVPDETNGKSDSIPIIAENSSAWVAAGSEFSAPSPLSVATEETKAVPSVADLSGYDRTVILNTITTWADAWSRQDLPVYLSHYSNSYLPEGGISYQQWLQMRTSRLQRQGRIKVEVSEAKIGLLEKNRVQVKFQQNYQSESFSDQIVKSINFVNESGGWKILTERSLGSVIVQNEY